MAVHEPYLVLDRRHFARVVVLQAAVRQQHVEVARLAVVMSHVAGHLEGLFAAPRQRAGGRLHILPPHSQASRPVLAQGALLHKLLVGVPLVLRNEQQHEVVALGVVEVTPVLRVEAGPDLAQVRAAHHGGAEAELGDEGLRIQAVQLRHAAHNLRVAHGRQGQEKDAEARGRRGHLALAQCWPNLTWGASLGLWS
eukprot:scaffold7067_cov245-Pinguiococcus_pyrenoidosus.AAC.7